MQTELAFGNRIRNRRRELDLTQDELARRVGCAAITIRKIEAEDARPSVQIAERLAMALSIPTGENAAFIRQARSIRPEADDKFTPPTTLEEYGRIDLSGRTVRGYLLSNKIGAGGMGVVYRALQPSIEREVALKIILPDFANHPNFIRRFEAEARTIARLEHPHIVPLYDYWREPGVAYLIMRWLRGGSLENLLMQGAMPLDSIIALFNQICPALHTAHRNSIVHQDIKPANILMDDDQNAYLADFGIAKNLTGPDLDNQNKLGVLLGTPEYIAPEQIRSFQSQPQSDIYSLGIILFELLTGTRPFLGASPYDIIRQHITEQVPPLAGFNLRLPTAFDNIVQRATAKSPADRYATALDLMRDLQLAGEIHPHGVPALTIVPEQTRKVNPYKGLNPFRQSDADDFFGRDSLIQQLLSRLGEPGELSRFLAVVGPSGSGKSSAVFAGLLPTLSSGGLLSSENWFVADFTPGVHPFQQLASALERVAVNKLPNVNRHLRNGKYGISHTINHILPNDTRLELVLVIDQFEEIFTLVEDEGERAQFLQSLLSACLDENSRLRIVITLRADFLEQALRYPDFGELVQRRSEFVLPLTLEEMELAITAPAKRAHLEFEEGLIAMILADVVDRPGNLPLLEYMLTRLFDHCQGHKASREDYRALGGVRGALSRHAEDIFGRLGPKQQEISRQIFIRLVSPGDGIEDTRRKVQQPEFDGLLPDEEKLEIPRIIDIFSRARMLSVDRDPATRNQTVEVAHEALITEWNRLLQWLDSARDDIRLQRKLSASANDWQEGGRDPSYLLSGNRLVHFEEWKGHSGIILTQVEREFLKASSDERDRILAAETVRVRREVETANRNAENEHVAAQRLRTRNRAITLVGTAALLLAVLATILGWKSNRDANAAQSNFIHAEALRLAAEATNAYNANASAELVALLSIRAMNLQYSPQADAALLAAARLNFPDMLYHQGEPLFTATISPDSKTMAVVSTEGHDLNLVNIATGDLIQSFRHPDAILSASFSPDGLLILTAGEDAVQRVWDTATGRLVTERPTGGRTAYSAFSQDGNRIYLGTIGDENAIVLWNIASGNEIQRWSVEGRPRVVSPDGNTAVLYLLEQSKLQLYDLTGKAPATTLDIHEAPTDVQFCNNGSTVLVGYFDGNARLWDTLTGALDLTFSGHQSTVRNVDCSPDGRLVVTGSDDRTARVWNMETGEILNTLRDEATVTQLALSPDGTKIVTISGDGAGNTVRVWSTQTSSQWPAYAGHSGIVSGVAISPDGKSLATADSTNTIRIWDALNGLLVHKFSSEDVVNFGLAFSPDGKRLASGLWHTGLIQLWDVKTGKEISRYPSDLVGGLNELAFSPDGKSLFYGGGTFMDTDEAKAIVLNLASGDIELAMPLAGTSDFYGADVSSDGKYLLTAHTDGTARIWDAQSGVLVHEYPAGEILVSGKFSPDGKSILMTGFNGLVSLWDVSEAEKLRDLVGHTDTVSRGVFSPDGSLIATASYDGTVRLWETATGRELRRYTGHTAAVENVAFSPNGDYLVSVGDDSAVHVWDINVQNTVVYLCSELHRDLSERERQEYGINDLTPTCP